jgi:hypothetical protein
MNHLRQKPHETASETPSKVENTSRLAKTPLALPID